MIAYKRIKYSKLFTFEADMVFLPESYNRKGIDPLPRFWLRPQKLLEYQNFSHNPSSINNGYVKNEDINLYVKNIEFIDTDLVNNQFVFLQNMPPYGFATETDYQEFVDITFDSSYSLNLETKYKSLKNKTFVKGDKNSLIARDHFTAKIQATRVQEFFEEKLVNIGEPKSLTIFNEV
jgi:hypothetical protein